MRISENVAVGCWVLAGLAIAVWFSTLVALGPAPGGTQVRDHDQDSHFNLPPRSEHDTRVPTTMQASQRRDSGNKQDRRAGQNLGEAIGSAAIAPWDIDIEPSGAGLPRGSGTSAQGAPIFAEQCSACHGEDGTGATTTASGAPAAPPVVSAVKRNGIDDTTLTIANYWPYATTLFDYIRRSMPWTSPRSLTDDQVYALTAYILAQNKLIDAKQVMNAQTLPKVQMPNRNGFMPRFPELMPAP
jgi:S-disulfanyl-L-cysteine oxidoreductase SoxD